MCSYFRNTPVNNRNQHPPPPPVNNRDQHPPSTIATAPPWVYPDPESHCSQSPKVGNPATCMIRAAIPRHVRPTVHLIIVKLQLNQDLDKGISPVVRNNGERSERAERGMDASHHYRASVTWVVLAGLGRTGTLSLRMKRFIICTKVITQI